MHPTLFHIGQFEITSFGAMVALAALVGMWLFQREAHWSGLSATVSDAGAIGVIGGLLGAKLLWTIEHMGTAPVADLLFSRGGLSWYGGLLGGVGSGLVYVRLRHWPVLAVVSAATPALAAGQMIGRIGCFLVGDDYGWPSDLPWAVSFPKGLPPTTIPVHPTQIYEAIGLTIVAMWLVRRRRGRAGDTVVVGSYLLAVGTLRFFVEFVRVHEPIALGLAPAHWISLGAVLTGLLLMLRSSARLDVVRLPRQV